MVILGRSHVQVDPTAALRTALVENKSNIANMVKLAAMTSNIEAIARELNALHAAGEKLRVGTGAIPASDDVLLK
jgi:hypothetical protein